MAWISPARKARSDGLQGVGAGEALVELAQLEDRDAGGEPLAPRSLERATGPEPRSVVDARSRARRRSSRAACRHHLTFGFSSSCERASFMLALVIDVDAGVDLVSTFSPFEAASAVLMPS